MPEFVIKTVRPDRGPGANLVYNTDDSSLFYEETGAPVRPTSPKRSIVASSFGMSVDRPGLKSSPRTLKISLGLSCNYECEYCSQRFVPRAEETNPGDIDGFLSGLDSWVTEPPQKIEFWGGEPLVYIKTLRPLAERLKKKFPDASLVMITNGSLLNPELNDWLDRMGFHIGLSHDGPGQHVRGPDPLMDPEKRAAILDLWRRLGPQKRMSFNAMINRNNPSRAEIQKFFVALTGDSSVPIGEGSFVDAYDEGGLNNSLTADELAPYRNLAFHELRTGQAANFTTIRNKIADFVNAISDGRKSSALGQKCGMDKPENIAVDLRGNVLTCQNVSAASVAPNGQSHKIGHISDLSAVQLNTATHWSNRDECPSCPMVQICKGSCMFLEGDLWETSCDNAFSDAIPVFSAGIEFLTGLVPVYIEGPQRHDRKDIWNRAKLVGKKRIIPISAAAPTEGHPA